ncbi:saccharopine dehydrogenase NADP-binding domain-containing protein [Spirillospora sp. CA-294931]|uniref:saccharopine dehydrogenase family protein n=1 Tax=Spirillospora sp. CA-294931 TaxID=3240042 RepID=UPI003D934191
MQRIVVFGGYGAVGREAAEALARWSPGTEIVVAGRSPSKADPVPGTTPLRVDVTNETDLAQALEGTDAALMCTEPPDAGVARTCLERGVHYVDVSASHTLLAEIAKLHGLAEERNATAVLSVGLVPGVTNLLARHRADRSAPDEIRIAALLGSGERHGPEAVRWTLDGLGMLDGSWRASFPAPYGIRTVHRFPFSDQYTLPETLGIKRVSTGLCLDSRMTTALLAAARRPTATRLLRNPRVRDALLTALTKIHLGGDDFAVTASDRQGTASFAGRRQSRATGLTAALVTLRLPELPSGVRHLDQVADPATFLSELAAHGFTLDLDD